MSIKQYFFYNVTNTMTFVPADKLTHSTPSFINLLLGNMVVGPMRFMGVPCWKSGPNCFNLVSFGQGATELDNGIQCPRSGCQRLRRRVPENPKHTPVKQIIRSMVDANNSRRFYCGEGLVPFVRRSKCSLRGAWPQGFHHGFEFQNSCSSICHTLPKSTCIVTITTAIKHDRQASLQTSNASRLRRYPSETRPSVFKPCHCWHWIELRLQRRLKPRPVAFIPSQPHYHTLTQCLCTHLSKYAKNMDKEKCASSLRTGGHARRHKVAAPWH